MNRIIVHRAKVIIQERDQESVETKILNQLENLNKRLEVVEVNVGGVSQVDDLNRRVEDLGGVLEEIRSTVRSIYEDRSESSTSTAKD